MHRQLLSLLLLGVMNCAAGMRSPHQETISVRVMDSELYPRHLWDETGPKTSLKLSPWVEISASAPPTLLIHSMNDPTDDVRHSLSYGVALNDLGVPVEMHLYARGGHAFGMRRTADPITTEWPKLVEKWLNTIEVF